MALDAEIIRATSDEPDAPEPYVTFESRISIRDVADLVFTRATHSTGAQGIAGFLMTMGFMGGIGGVHPDLWVPPLILSVAIGTGFILLPFIWWSYLAAPELIQSTVEADASGMIVNVGDRQIRHPWTVYRAAQETSRLFILTSRVVQPQMFTKRGVAPEDAAAFRAVLESVGLLREMDTGPRYRPWLAFLGGALAALATLLVAGAIRI